jgi:hypothetical protein
MSFLAGRGRICMRIISRDLTRPAGTAITLDPAIARRGVDR